jgi:hypothetical protein
MSDRTSKPKSCMNRRTFLTRLGTAAVAAPLIMPMRARAANQPAPGVTTATARTFISRLQPAVASGGFELPDHWVWCGAPIRGEDGRYHLFASRAGCNGVASI